MTIQDLHIAVKMELDKSTMSGYTNFSENEMDYFINKAYLMLVNQKFTGHNELQQKFEDGTKRLMDLRNLIVQTNLDGVLDVHRIKNEFLFDTKNNVDILFPIQYVINFNLLNGSSDTRTAILIKHEDSNKFKQTSNNNPWIPEPVILFDSNNINVYVDPVDLLNYTGEAILNLIYIKRPNRLQYWIYDSFGNVSPNLSGDSTQIPEIDEHVHQEIVSLAVDLMLDNIESQRIQTHPQLTQIKE